MNEQLERELLGRLNEWLPVVDSLGPETPLIQSGLLDSLALFNVVMWVEEQIGMPVDVSAVDLANEWNTVAGILRFVEKQRNGRPSS
ncbi:MAG: phosphopantetheine-binding protein [Gemmatimonadales bacterium]